MSILGRLFGGEKKKSFEGDSWTLAPILNQLFGSENITDKRLQLQSNKNWVYACARAIAEGIGSIDFKLFQVDGDERREVPDHDLLTLLDTVNDTMTRFELLESLSYHLELTGEAYWFLDGVKSWEDRPTAIYPINPKYIKIHKAQLPEMVAYYEYDNGETSKRFEPYQILPFKYTNPDDPYKGLGVVEPASEVIEADTAARLWNKAFFKNAARPDAVLETEGALNESQQKSIRESFERIFKGIRNAHKVAILPKGTVYKPIQSTQAEIGFNELLKNDRDEILAMFRTPRSVLGITDDVNRANAEATLYFFMLFTIKPKMKRIVAYLNEFLTPRYGEGLILDFADPVPENEERITTTIQAALGQQPYMSVDEARQLRGLPPLKDGAGASVMGNFTMIPIGQPEEPAKSAPKPAVRTGGGFTRPASRRAASFKKRKELSKQVADAVIKSIQDNLNSLTDEFWENRWKVFDKTATEYEAAALEALKKEMRREKREVLENLKGEVDKGFNGEVKSLASRLLDKDTAVRAIVDSILPLMTDLYGKEAAEAMALVAAGQAVDMTTDMVHIVLDNGLFFLAKSYTAETLELLEKKLKEGFDAGEGYDDMAQRVEQVFEFSENYRAKRVARTETVRIGNAATKEAWRQSRVVKTIKWYTAPSDVCEFCAPMDGKTIDIEDNFFDLGDRVTGSNGETLDIDYSDVGNPPLHPDCRCFIRPELISIITDDSG